MYNKPSGITQNTQELSGNMISALKHVFQDFSAFTKTNFPFPFEF